MNAKPLLHRFYPIVPDFAWLARLVPLGVKTIQLRLKHAATDEVRRQIGESLELCARHDATLIVNDYWREAIDCDSQFIHLGQKDLASADLPAIRAAGLRLGVSTHSHAELATALAADPDYVALGPVYETTLKKMPWAPQGLERLRDWVNRAARPVVAIGGITLERAPAVYDTGVASIAVVSDVVANPDPEQRVRDWLRIADA